MTEYLETDAGRRIAYARHEGRGPGVVFLGGFRSDMTGTKAQFLFGFLDRAEQIAPAAQDVDAPDVGTCATCGMPTTAEVCAFCRQRERILKTLPVAG